MTARDVIYGGQRLAAVLGAALLLTGASQCSFGGHDFGPASHSDTNQIAIAPISTFGSIVAAATDFSTGSATVKLDGNAVDESQLRPGQVVTLSGTVASGGLTGTAAAASVTNKLIGPVSAIDPGAGSFTVLGQTVHVSGNTSVGPGFTLPDVAGFPVGTVLVIDGYRTSTGLVASRIDLPLAGQVLHVAGVVSGLDGFVHQFSINGTRIDYGSASGGLPSLVTDGSYVIASGGSSTNSTTLQATLVTAAKESPAGASGDHGVVHGAVTRFATSTDFDVAGQTVTTSAATTFIHGAQTDVMLDRELEVAGTYSSSGVLAASTVDVTPAPIFRVVGPVASLDPSGATLTIDGITVSTSRATRWDDQSGQGIKAFGLSRVTTGDWVEVRGLPGPGTAATARVVERRVVPSPAFVELQDVPTAIAAPAFTLTGVPVDTRTATFADASGQPLSPSGFFAQAAGRVVRVRGAFIAGAVTAAAVALRP